MEIKHFYKKCTHLNLFLLFSNSFPAHAPLILFSLAAEVSDDRRTI